MNLPVWRRADTLRAGMWVVLSGRPTEVLGIRTFDDDEYVWLMVKANALPFRPDEELMCLTDGGQS